MLVNTSSTLHTAEHEIFLRAVKCRARLVLITQVSLAVSFFVIWEAAARARLIDAFIFSQPTRVIAGAQGLLATGQLWEHIGATLGMTLLGFALSSLFGIAIAVALWWNSFWRKVLEPYLVMLNSMPKTALAPVIIVIFGINFRSVLITAILTSIVVTIMNMLQAFLEVNQEKIKLIYTFGGSRIQALTKVILPASIPSIFNTLRINIGLSFIGVVVGEFLVARVGLGALIIYGSQIFRMDWVMLSILLLMAMAAGLYRAVAWLEKVFGFKA
ncbi:MAG: ABC transporter permease [Defluviitaleaceae bacterium]|nr:ABC transporter permease [Defluviitaleaceae bacterium]